MGTAAGDILFVAGHRTRVATATQSGDVDAYLAKWNSAGTKLWDRRYGDPIDQDESYALARDTDGFLYLAGTTFGSISGSAQVAPMHFC